MESEFRPCCPRCFSPSHVPFAIRLPFPEKEIRVEVYGDALRHCYNCGFHFSKGDAIDLREVLMEEPQVSLDFHQMAPLVLPLDWRPM